MIPDIILPVRWASRSSGELCSQATTLVTILGAFYNCHQLMCSEEETIISAYIFSSPEHKVLKVSYCDHPVSGVRRQSSVVRRPSCVVNNSFKAHLLLNYWTNFKIISHKCSPEAPLPKLLKWFRSAEKNGRQS